MESWEIKKWTVTMTFRKREDEPVEITQKNTPIPGNDFGKQVKLDEHIERTRPKQKEH